MPKPGIPTIILAGSDRQAVELPPSGEGKHALGGHKGVDIQVGGHPLIELLIRRLRTCPEFDPIMVAGPKQVYGGLDPSVSVIDTDSTVGNNIRAGIDAFLARNERGMVAFTACDILPDPKDLRAQLDDFHGWGECDLWYPLVRVPEDTDKLGAFAWKPEYRIVPESGAPPVRVLPCHLMIADPRALRLGILYHLLEIAYRTRNRPIAVRRTSMVTRVLGSLLIHDLLHILRLRAPTLTWTVLAHGLGVARKLRAGSLLRAELEEAVAKIILRARHRRRFPGRGVRLPILEGLTLAADIDTVEEAQEVERAWKRGGDPHSDAAK